MDMDAFKYDVFISHAVEDKIDIANELCERLEESGLRVWYSGNELSIGDRIESLIQKGLEQSHFGIAILTENYLRKSWTMREFYSLLAKEKEGRKVILPVLHNVSVDDLKAKDLTIADKFGISSERGLSQVVDTLVKTIKKERQLQYAADKYPKALNETGKIHPKLYINSIFLSLLLSLLIGICGFALYRNINEDIPPEEVLNTAIKERIDKLLFRVVAEHDVDFPKENFQRSTIDDLKNKYAQFLKIKAKQENLYYFTNGDENHYLKDKIEPLLHIDVTARPSSVYTENKETPEVYFKEEHQHLHNMKLEYIMINKDTVVYRIQEKKTRKGFRYYVDVKYENPIRYISVGLTFSKYPDYKKRKEVEYLGLKPLETYVFEKSKDGWSLKNVR